MSAIAATIRPSTALLALCLLLAQSATAIPLDRNFSQLQHKAWLVKDGAPPSMSSLAQTEDAYLWIGTTNGLFRFDGLTFERYQPRQGSYPGSVVGTLKAQPGGGLWIGWVQGGISLLKDGVLTNYSEEEGIGSGAVWEFHIDRAGTVWASGVRGLARFDGLHWQKLGPREGLTAREVSTLFTDSDGTVGAFSEQGLFLWKPGSARFSPPVGRREPEPSDSLQRGPNGRIYIRDDAGIRVIDSLARFGQEAPQRICRFAAPAHGAMLIDSSGTLWFDQNKELHRIAPDSKGAFDRTGLRAGTETFANEEGLSKGPASAIFEDREHNVWVLMAGRIERFRQVDINRFTPHTYSVRPGNAHLLPGPDGSMMLDPTDDQSWLRVAADGTVLERHPGILYDLMPAADGAIWAREPSTLRRWRAGVAEATIALPPDMGPVNKLRGLVQQKDGTLWASVLGSGVFRHREGRWEREPLLPGQGKREPMTMLADRRGQMWFGYDDNTIARLDSGKLTLFSSAQGVNLKRVSALYEAQGQLWAGGANGIAMLHAERFSPLNITPAKADNVSAIRIAPSGDMWVNSSSGVLRLPAAEVRQAIANVDHVARARTFDALDGLVGVANAGMVQSLEVASDGRIWIATYTGLGWIEPPRLLALKAPPPPLIQALRVGETRYQEPRQLRLPPNSRDVQIDYTIAVLATPERVRFRFFLDGYDQQWHDAGTRRQAFYTGLPPGDYHFRVMAENGGGNWGPEGDGLHFSVLPAWYQTWWFKSFAAAAAVGLGWLLYRFRLNRVELQYKVQLEVRQAERERIARELHDTLLQGTQALILDFHNAAARLPVQDPARLPMDRALSRADAMLAEGRDQIHDLRASDLAGAGAATLIARDGADLVQQHGLRFDWRESGRPRDILPATGHELYRIAMEAIANAVRHAGARTIGVHLAYHPMSLRLTVSDDGTGLAPEVLAQGGRDGHWGLPGLHERAARLRARLRIDSSAGQGTVIRLRIPAHLAHGRKAGWFRRWR